MLSSHNTVNSQTFFQKQPIWQKCKKGAKLARKNAQSELPENLVVQRCYQKQTTEERRQLDSKCQICQISSYKTFVDAKTQKLLPIGSKITRRVDQWSHQHTQGSKIDQRSQQFHLYKLLGSCGLFCNKDKGIITQPAGSCQKRSDQIKHSAGAHALMQPNPTQARIPGPTNSTSAGVHSLTQLSPAQARFRVGKISLKRAEQIVRELLSNRQ